MLRFEFGRSMIALLSFLGLAWVIHPPKALADCPPGSFDYGPFWPDALVESVVLAHYLDTLGADGPLTVQPDDYERAARDMDLIRAAIADAPGGHTWEFAPDQIIIETLDAEDEALRCLNDHFAAVMVPIFSPPSSSYQVFFPRAINVLRMAETYAALPSITRAEPNPSSGVWCHPTWHYQRLPSGTQRWQLYNAVDSTRGCRFIGEWSLEVSADGVLSEWCSGDLNEDGAIDLPDLAMLLNAFGAAHPDALYDEQADLDANREVDIVDLSVLLARFGATCP